MPRSKPPPPPPSALEDHIGFWMRFVSNHVSGRFRKLLEERGVSITEWVALRTLLQHGGATHQALIDALGMTKGAASKVVTRLEDKGLAARESLADSGRAQQIVLTPAGRRLLPQLAALADQNDDHFFAHLSPEQRSALKAMLVATVRAHQLKEIPVE